jgi:hypothetical protein
MSVSPLLPQADLLRLADEHGSIEIDRRFAPLFLCDWRGRLSIEVVSSFFEFSAEVADRALAELVRVAYVNDVDSIERPDSEVRRLIGDLSVDLERTGRRAAMVGSWQILRNPLIRGVLKATSWVTNGLVDGRVARNWEDGIQLAIAALVAIGQPVPEIDATGYVFPSSRGLSVRA